MPATSRPVAIARPARRRPIGTLAALGSIIAVVLLVKPWAGPPSPTAEGRVVKPAPAATAAIPARPIPTEPAAPGIGSLAGHSGTWGVGTAGLVARDLAGSWVDWAPVTPVDVEPAAGPPTADDGRQPCLGSPVVVGGPLFVAVTARPTCRWIVDWSRGASRMAGRLRSPI